MRSSKKEYEAVAKRCSSYAKTTNSELSNCVSCDCTSCLNCEHFAPDEQIYTTQLQKISSHPSTIQNIFGIRKERNNRQHNLPIVSLTYIPVLILNTPE